MLFKSLFGKSRFMKRLFFLSFLSLAFSCLSTSALQAEEQAKLLPLDGAYGDNFGYSVSIDGEYAIVGAWEDDDNGSGSGSAYIFKRDGTVWSEQAKLTASDGYSGDHFGVSVSIDGEYAIVGAPGYRYQRGSAYIFKRDGEAWTQQAKLLASDGYSSDDFGFSVSIDGEYTIVGAYGDSDNGYQSGSAYIFKRNGEIWTQQAKLLASDGYDNDCFGVSVSIDGEYVIVGAIYDDDNGSNSGSAYIFKRDGMAWIQQAKLLASDGYNSDFFGRSVSIDGDYAIIGAYQDYDNGSDSGSAYIFTRDVTDWIQQAKLLPSDGYGRDHFGYSVSINSECAIVGAFQDDDNGLSSGSAYIFKRDGTVWSEQDKLLASDGYDVDNFGWSVSIDGDYAIVGARYDDDNGSNSGSAYIFEVFKAGPVIEVAIDIKPAACPNPLSVYSYGILPVVILGTEDFDVNEIDVVSVRLNDVAPFRHNYEDVSTPVLDANDCNCTAEGADGYLDMILKFETEDITNTLPDVNDGDVVELPITGVLTDATPIEGSDCIVIKGRYKPMNRGDINQDGVVNMVDLAIVSDNWLKFAP